MRSRNTLTSLAAACSTVFFAAARSHASTLAGPFTITVASNTDTYYVLTGSSGAVYDILQQDTWRNDQAEATALNTNLITITSAAQNATVVSDVAQDFANANINLSNVPLWIGLEDQSHDPNFGGTADGPGGANTQHAANFAWIDGSTAAYRNWNTATNEPSDTSPGEYYTAIDWHYASGDSTALGTWDDTPNTGTAGFGGNTGNDTGYFGIAYVPEPATALLFLGALSLTLKRPSSRTQIPS
jgi:hypothetical protein